MRFAKRETNFNFMKLLFMTAWNILKHFEIKMRIKIIDFHCMRLTNWKQVIFEFQEFDKTSFTKWYEG